MDQAATTIYTVGHGDRSLVEFMALLREAGVGCVVDVRAYPVSSRHPRFSRQNLRRVLEYAGVSYLWEGKPLGGFRKPRADSRNQSLAGAARGFADHMQCVEFASAANRLLALASHASVVLFCAERDPAECHRLLIADYLAGGGTRVVHLVAPGEYREHLASDRARWDGDSLVYDGRATAESPLVLPVAGAVTAAA